MDEGGNGYDFTMPSGSEFVPGKFGKALNMSSDSRVKVSDNRGILGIPEFTVDCWVKPDVSDLKAPQIIWMADEHPNYTLKMERDRTLTFSWVHKPNGTHAYLKTDAPLKVGEWNRVTVVRDFGHKDDGKENTQRIYIDGRLAAEAKTDGYFYPYSYFWLGVTPYFKSRYEKNANGFAGAIDEFRILSRALTPEEL